MKVLIVESDTETLTRLQKGLQDKGCVVESTTSGSEAIQFAHRYYYDVVVLDFYLHDMNGAEVCDKIRIKKNSLPIVVVSKKVEQKIKLAMLSVCDDYMIRPVCVHELFTRLHAITRRGPIVQTDVLEACDLRMDTMHHIVTLQGSPIHLRNKEFALLEYFMRNYGVVLSREKILEHVWDRHTNLFTNTVDVHVRLLRKCLYSDKCSYIQTIPKRGYKFSVKHKDTQ